MFGSITSTVGAKAGSLESKLVLYIILGVLALVIINLLLDGIRKYIRGLDTAALGVLFIWLGHEAAGISLVSVLTNLLYLVGGTLLAAGLLVFILLKMFRRKRNARRSGPPMPEDAGKDVKEKPEPAAKDAEKQE